MLSFQFVGIRIEMTASFLALGTYKVLSYATNNQTSVSVIDLHFIVLITVLQNMNLHSF